MMNADDCYYPLGHFCLYECIESGGYAHVYRAIDVLLDREVAIKVFKTPINPLDPEAFEKCAFEARTQARLKHPHIISIIEFNIESSTPYMVMEYAEKGSLRNIHPFGRRLEWIVILNYLKQITDALTYIHLQGIIHQDIKPENMLMNENYEVLLSDFGTVAFMQHTGSLRPLEFVGTYHYAAPERFASAVSTPASDIYSLAVVVFEWATGEHLFTGSPPQIAYKHRSVKPSSRRMSALGISRPIQRVLLKALSKDPNKRYQNASDFFHALRASVYKTEKKRNRYILFVTTAISILGALLPALLLHSILVLCILLPILLTASLLSNSARERKLKNL